AKVWGAFPNELDLQNGVIQGTLTVGGGFSFVLRVTDSASNTAYKSFTIYVNRLTISPPSQLPPAASGQSYSYQLMGTGVGTLKWSIENTPQTLPAGLTLSADGLVSGITTAAPGFYNFYVKVRDEANQVLFQWFSVQVEAPLTITTALLNDGVAPWSYGWCLSAVGGGYPRTWSI